MPTLETLPGEVIEQIASRIGDVRDLTSFRSAGPRLYYATTDLFAQKVQSTPWLVAPHSLRVLKDIAGNAATASKLRALRLGSHYLRSPVGQEVVNWQYDDPSIFSTLPLDLEAKEIKITIHGDGQHRKFLWYCWQQHTFCQTEEDLRSLTEILRRLPNLEHVEVSDGEFLHGHIAGRLQFHQVFEPGTCYGMGIVKRETNRNYDSMASPRYRMSGYGYATVLITGSLRNAHENNGLGHNFGLVLKALAATRRPIKSLRIWHWNKKNQLHCVPVPFIPRLDDASTSLSAGLAVSLANLADLSLMLRYMPDHLVPHNRRRCQNDFLPTLVQLAPRLKRLTLVFGDGFTQRWTCDLALMKALRKFSRQTVLPCLEMLELRQATIRYKDLKRLWKRLRHTATSVRLSAIGLVGGTWIKFFQRLEKSYNPKNLDVDIAVTSPRSVQLCFSWLTEKPDESALLDCPSRVDFVNMPTGVVFFDLGGMAQCGKCSMPMMLGDDDYHHNDCLHVSFRHSLVLTEVEAGVSEGLKTMLSATFLSTGELCKLWRARELGH